ncbi:MAG: hypothetical protein NEHIOOID_00001 [Holosporales bacterium]
MKLKVLVIAVIVQLLNAAEQNPPSLNTMSLAEIRKHLGQDHAQKMRTHQEARNRDAIAAFLTQEEQGRASVENAFFQDVDALYQAHCEKHQLILDHQAALNRFFTQDEFGWENADVINVYNFYTKHVNCAETNFLDWVRQHPNVSPFLLGQMNTYEIHRSVLDISFYHFLILSQSIMKQTTDLVSWNVNVTLIQCLVEQNNIEKDVQLGWIHEKLSFAPAKQNFFENYFYCALSTQWQANNENVSLSSIGAVESLNVLEKHSYYIEAYLGEKSRKRALQRSS